MGWLKNWRRERSIRSRAIFRFHDGEKERSVDPLAIFRALRSLPDFDWETDAKGVERGDDDSIVRTLAAIRQTFGVKPFDADKLTGLTDGETLNLLSEFVWYLESLKKNGSGPQTSPEPTDSMPPLGSTESDSTTKPASGSGSTSNEPNSAAPEASSPVSVPPSVE